MTTFPGFLDDILKLFGCRLPFVPFSVKMIPHCFNNVEVLVLGRIHPYIRPVATDFQSTSCVFWHTSAYSRCFPSLKMASWQPPFHGDHFWSDVSLRYCQVLLDFSFFLKDIPLDTVPLLLFRPATTSFVFHLSSYLSFIKNTLHTMLVIFFLAKSSLGITSLVQKYCFMSVKLCEMKTNYVSFWKAKYLKVQFRISSLLSCLLWVDTTLVHPISFILWL